MPKTHLQLLREKAGIKTDAQFRGSSAKRGYNYQWQKYRLRFLQLHPLCRQCERDGRTTLANEVDHIIPHRGDKKLFWDVKNHQGLCKSCHSKKTAAGG